MAHSLATNFVANAFPNHARRLVLNRSSALRSKPRPLARAMSTNSKTVAAAAAADGAAPAAPIVQYVVLRRDLGKAFGMKPIIVSTHTHCTLLSRAVHRLHIS
jgi:hypothetical protein